jgi:hypothetical protein
MRAEGQYCGIARRGLRYYLHLAVSWREETLLDASENR